MEWLNMTPDRFRAETFPSGPFAWVRDGVESYCRVLLPDETLLRACEEFAEGYDCGDYDRPVVCVGTLFTSEGDRLDDHRFEVGPKK